MPEDLFTELFQALQVYGYIGAFVISVLGSFIPFLPVPYLIPVVLMAERLDPLILGIAAGVGGALGKLTSYGLGRAGRRILGEEKRRRMTALGKLIRRYGMLAVFLFALTPLPDDIIYVPIGLANFSIIRFMIANMLGKIVLSWMVAYGGKIYFDYAKIFLGEGGSPIAVAAALIAMIIITIVLLKIDWEQVLRLAEDKGIRGVIDGILQSFRPRRKE